MKQDKFLFVIVITIVILMVLAVGVFLVRQDAQDYVVDDSPEGIVHNFIFAIQKEDYQRAYEYLDNGKNKPTFLEFRTFYSNNDLDRYGIQISGSEIYEDVEGPPVAVVDLVFIESNNDPLSSGYRSSGPVNLVLKDGVWKVTEFPYRLWSWDWFQKE